jgi:hypothetical protein
MSFSVGDLFDRGLKCAHGLRPHLVEVSAQPGDAFWIQLVDAAGSCPAVCDQSRVFEDAQVLGDRWTADGKIAGKFIDGDGPASELLEDGHAGRVAEGVEAGL